MTIFRNNFFLKRQYNLSRIMKFRLFMAVVRQTLMFECEKWMVTTQIVSRSFELLFL